MTLLWSEKVPLAGPAPSTSRLAAIFGQSKDSLGHQHVYVVVSSRAKGLSVGINMNPDKRCNFDCVYCEVSRRGDEPARKVDLEVMAGELTCTLAAIHSGGLGERTCYRNVPPELLELKHVALSGDGEPTLAPNFLEIVETVTHVRALARVPFFKIVLITNASGLDLPQVQEGLKLFTAQDEIWAKLDAGTQEAHERINRTEVPLEQVLRNIQLAGRRRPVVIQSLFAMMDQRAPGAHEIETYVNRLCELKAAGTQISLVQIYSPNRPCARAGVEHLPLRNLSIIAQTVRKATGLKVEVY